MMMAGVSWLANVVPVLCFRICATRLDNVVSTSCFNICAEGLDNFVPALCFTVYAVCFIPIDTTGCANIWCELCLYRTVSFFSSFITQNCFQYLDKIVVVKSLCSINKK